MPSCPFAPGKPFDGGCRFKGRRHGDRDGAGTDQGGGRAARLDRRTRRSRNLTWSRRGASGAAPPGSSSGPASTEEVAAVVRICAEARLPIVPQGGNTGLVGGGVPPEDGHNIVLALGRMNRIRAIDPVNFTMTVEAGCILAHLQQAAAEADRLFPLSLGAEGSCQIGGNLSTNAGGIAVLRYGNTRELTLGLEVVLPGRADLGRAARAAQGQYRLRSEAALHRRRRHARDHHRRDPEALPEAARSRDRVSRARQGRGCHGALRSRPRRHRRSADRLRADPARGARSGAGPRARDDRSAGGAPSLVRPARNVVEPDRERHPRAFGEAARNRARQRIWSPTASSPRAGRKPRSSGRSARRSSRRSSIRARSSTTSRCRSAGSPTSSSAPPPG